jgi:hypothetical protein
MLVTGESILEWHALEKHQTMVSAPAEVAYGATLPT